MRTILVHLNVEVPDDLEADDMAQAVRREVSGALEVGTDEEQTPGLYAGHWTIPLAEEV